MPLSIAFSVCQSQGCRPLHWSLILVTVKIAHVSFSSAGGAGSVAQNLVLAQSRLGVDSCLKTLTDADLWSDPFSNIPVTLSAGFDNFVMKDPSFSGQLSLLRSRVSSMNIKDVSKFNILNFHWMEGVLSFREIIELGQKNRVFWTIHDMAPITGGCHYPGDCLKFQKDCGDCPAVKRPFKSHVTSKFSSKLALAAAPNQITYIAPSDWHLNNLRKSPVLQNSDLVKIRNPINLAFFREPVRRVRKNQVFKMCVIASHLDNKTKQIGKLLDALATLREDEHYDFELLLIGAKGGLEVGHLSWVTLAGPRFAAEIPALLEGVSLNLVFSTVETYGLTVMETAALGIPTLSLSHSGLKEQILDQESGFLAETELDFFVILGQLLKNTNRLLRTGELARDFAYRSSHPDAIAREYLNLYEEKGARDEF